jgi:hypothetical protein
MGRSYRPQHWNHQTFWPSGRGFRHVLFSDPGYLDWSSIWFSSDPTGKFQDSISIKPRPLPFNYFPIHQSSVIKNLIIQNCTVLRMTGLLHSIQKKCQHLKVCDGSTLIQILCFGTLSMFLFLFKTPSCYYLKTQRFGDGFCLRLHKLLDLIYITSTDLVIRSFFNWYSGGGVQLGPLGTVRSP